MIQRKLRLNTRPMQTTALILAAIMIVPIFSGAAGPTPRIADPASEDPLAAELTPTNLEFIRGLGAHGTGAGEPAQIQLGTVTTDGQEHPLLANATLTPTTVVWRADLPLPTAEVTLWWDLLERHFTSPAMVGADKCASMGSNVTCTTHKDAIEVVEFDPYLAQIQFTMGRPDSVWFGHGRGYIVLRQDGDGIAVEAEAEDPEALVHVLPEWFAKLTSFAGMAPASDVRYESKSALSVRASRAPPEPAAQVTALDGSLTLFEPNLNDPNYVLTSGAGLYQTEGSPVTGWRLAIPATPTAYSGSFAWATGGGLPAYAPLSDELLILNDIDLRSATSASIKFMTWMELETGYDYGRALLSVENSTSRALIQPSGLSYSPLREGGEGWTGNSNGWAAVTLDLTSHVGSTVDIILQFRSDAVVQHRGWLIDDVQLVRNGAIIFTDTSEEAWTPQGGWTLGRPLTGPQSGFSPNTNAWAVASNAIYRSGTSATLQLPLIDTMEVTQARFTFRHWLKAEFPHDIARLEASDNGGETWRIIEPAGGLGYSTLAESQRGWSGNTLGWQTATFDLRPYLVGPIHLRFVFTSDSTIQDAGWYISDIKIDSNAAQYTSAAYPSVAMPTDSATLYFGAPNTEGSLEAPNGQKLTLRYVGSLTTGVVANLSFNGSVVARRAVVGPLGPVSVPASDFVVTGAPLVFPRATATWTLKPAPVTGGFGGSRLFIAGKVFDDVATTSEPIQGNGEGRFSASGAGTVRWNWHNQLDPRYDTTLISTSTPEQTSSDIRRYVDRDADGDAFSDKEEILGNADAALATSTPLTDDDGDGLPNAVEEARDAALDPLTARLSSRINTNLGGENWHHMDFWRRVELTNDSPNAILQDYDLDTIPDYRDQYNEPTEADAYIEGSDPNNYLEIQFGQPVVQLAAVISPDWKTALLVVHNPDLGSSAGPITYSEFFAELDAYQAATNADRALSRILKSHTTSDMDFYRIRNPAPTVGPAARIGLSMFDGAPAAGTWLVAKDINIPGTTLSVADRVMTVPDVPPSDLPSVGTLRMGWFFVNHHSQKVDCITYSVFLSSGPCKKIPTAQGMRFFGAEPAANIAGLIGVIRDEYMRAAAIPSVFSQLSAPRVVELPAQSAWSMPDVAEIEQLGTADLTIVHGTLASADAGAAARRMFDWTYLYEIPSAKFAGMPVVTIGLEPSDLSTEGTSLVIHGSVLQALGFSAAQEQQIFIDEEHRAGSSVITSDVDSDGYLDYTVSIPHFSKSWVRVTPAGLGKVNDIELVSTTAGFAAAGPGKLWVYDANAGGTQWYSVDLSFPYNTANLVAVSATSANEAFFAGGCAPVGGSGSLVGTLIRLWRTGSGGAWQHQVISWPLPNGHDGQCYPLVDVEAWYSGRISALTRTGLVICQDPYGSGYGCVYLAGPVPQGQRFDALESASYDTSFVTSRIDSTNSNLYQFSWSWGWAEYGCCMPISRPEGQEGGSFFTMTRDNRGIWGTGYIRNLLYFGLDPSAWNPYTIPPTPVHGDFGGRAIAGFDPMETWVVGRVGWPVMARKVNDVWTEHSFESGGGSEGFYSIDFYQRDMGFAGGVGQFYKYGGTNDPPQAVVLPPQNCSTTLDVCTLDGAFTYDPDGDPIVSYSWDFGDRTAQASGQIVTHRWREDGSYVAALSATDAQGATGTGTTSPTIQLYSLTSGQLITPSFTAAGQQDYYKISIPAAQDLLRVQLTVPSGSNFDVYVKRGSKPTTSSWEAASTNSTGHDDARIAAPTSGDYYVMVRDQSGSGTYGLVASAIQRPSVPSITATPNPVEVSTLTTLSGVSTGSTPLFYWINWGDGAALQRVPASGTLASGVSYSATHSFAAVSDYTVTVTAVDEHGLASTNTATVHARVPPVGSTGDATSIARNSASLVGEVQHLGGADSITYWFEYGTTVNYGTTTPHQVVTSTGGVTAAITDLADNTTYNYRLALSNAVGTRTGTNHELRTQPNVGPSSPTLNQQKLVTERNEAFFLTGMAIDPEGDAIYYLIDWKDGTTTRIPEFGTVPSGTGYNTTHAYASFGTYQITAQTFDMTNNAAGSLQNFTVHRVIDRPAGSTTGSVVTGRTTAQAQGSLTTLGGDPNGVLAWFEYGPNDGTYPWRTPGQTYTATGAIAHPISGLTPGGGYQFRLVVSNGWGSTRAAPLNFVTNVAPVITPIDAFSSKISDDTSVSFGVYYSDVQNEAPASGHPRLILNGNAIPMTKLNPSDTDYANGVTYRTTQTLGAGIYSYRYDVADAVGTEVTPGRHAMLIVSRTLNFHEPLGCTQNNCPTGGLPSDSWTAEDGTPRDGSLSGPRWHVALVPNLPGVGDVPTRTWTSARALWFGNQGGDNYDNAGQRAAGSVLTPLLDLSSSSPQAVRFHTYFDTEDNDTRFDKKRVYVQPVDSPEKLILDLNEPFEGYQKWWAVSASLAEWQGKQVRIRFEFDTVDGVANDHLGWYINNIVVGRDHDVDGIPDHAEAADRYALTWFAPAKAQSVPPGSSRSSYVYGVQYSYASAAYAEIAVTMNWGTSTIVLNDSTYSSTVFQRGAFGPGASPKSQNGNNWLIRVDLIAAGWPAKTLDLPRNVTTTLIADFGSPFNPTLRAFAIQASGKTSPLALDSDFDGVHDREELNGIGTVPVSRDPDNDGAPDKLDRRPMTPDDAPAITNIRRLNGDWKNGIAFDTVSRWGISDVRVTLLTAGGEQVLSDASASHVGSSWTWAYPSGSVPREVKIYVNDTFHNAGWTTLTFSQGSNPEPTQFKLDTRVYQAGAPLVVTTGAAAAPLAPGVAVVAVVVFVGLIVAGLGYFAYQALQSQSELPSATLSNVITQRLHPTIDQASWALTTGELGCVNRIFMLRGFANAYSARGADGIRKTHFSATTTLSTVAAQFGSALSATSNKRVTQISPTEGVLMWFEPSTQTLHRWTLDIDKASCQAEVTGKSQHKTGKLDATTIGLLMGTGALGLYVLSKAIPPPEVEHDDPTTVYILDGRDRARVVESYPADLPSYVGKAANRYLDHVFNDPAGFDRALKYAAMQQAFSAVETGSSVSQTERQLNPLWYWGPRTQSNTRSTSPPMLSIIRDANLGVYDIDDQGAMTAWNETAAADWKLVANPSILDMIKASEEAICAWANAHPSPRAGLVPAAVEVRDALIVLEVADSTAQFTRGGC